jgi:integrase/recombinase XerC
MAGMALERREGTLLQRAEGWAALPHDARRRRAAEAVRDGELGALRTLLESYLSLYARAGLSTSRATHSTYWRGARRLLSWCDRAAVKVHQVDTDAARRFVASLQGAGLADKSAAVYLTGARQLVAALRWAGLGDGDPFEGLSVRDRTPAVEKARPYSDGELVALLRAADDRERAFVLLAADGGLRLAELSALLWRDVDLTGRTARIVGKGGKLRTVRLTRRLVAALESWRPSAPMLQGRVLGASRRRWQQIMTSLCRRAGVTSRGVHALRHTAGTRLYAASKDLLVVARHLGHASVSTAAIYSHLCGAAYAEAVDALDAEC